MIDRKPFFRAALVGNVATGVAQTLDTYGPAAVCYLYMEDAL